MKKNSQICVSLIYPYLAQAEFLGHDRTQLINELGLNKFMSGNAFQRMPFTAFIRAVHQIIEVTALPELGLMTGPNFHPSTLGPLAYLIMNSPTIEQAYRSFLSYEFMLNEAVTSKLIVAEHTACNSVSYEGFSDEEVYPVVEAYFSSLLGYMRFLSFRPRKDTTFAKEVCLKHQPYADVNLYENIFGAPVKFGQEINCITFEKEMLSYKIPGADARIVSRAIVELDAIQQTFKRERQFSNEVYDFIKEGFYTSLPTTEEAAKHFAMSVSTFQRRLKDESSTFKGLVELVRMDKAEVHLADSRLSLADVSYRLGFSSPPAFFKAFKRWTGQTPADYRKELNKHTAEQLDIKTDLDRHTD